MWEFINKNLSRARKGVKTTKQDRYSTFPNCFRSRGSVWQSEEIGKTVVKKWIRRATVASNSDQEWPEDLWSVPEMTSLLARGEHTLAAYMSGGLLDKFGQERQTILGNSQASRNSVNGKFVSSSPGSVPLAPSHTDADRLSTKILIEEPEKAVQRLTKPRITFNRRDSDINQVLINQDLTHCAVFASRRQDQNDRNDLMSRLTAGVAANEIKDVTINGLFEDNIRLDKRVVKIL
jgi:hypothetical protein